MIFTPGIGRVVVIPDGDISDSLGVRVNNFVEPYNSKAVSGVISHIAADFPYLGRNADIRRHGGKVQDTREMEEEIGLKADVPCEVKVGDRVLFNYMFNIDDDRDEWTVVDGKYVMPYLALWARVDGDKLYPLNGQVLVFPIEKSALAVKERRAGLYEVVAEGATARHYSDGWPPDEGWPSLLGRKVIIDPTYPIAIESRLMAQWNVGRERIHIVNRCHIAAILNTK